MKIFLAQINPLVGDLRGNSELILDACKEAKSRNANLVLTPELSLWGYPPRDLLLNSLLLKEQHKVLDAISKAISLEATGLKALIAKTGPTGYFLV